MTVKKETIKGKGREGKKKEHENQWRTREEHMGEREEGNTENRKSNLRLHGGETFIPSV